MWTIFGWNCSHQIIYICSIHSCNIILEYSVMCVIPFFQMKQNDKSKCGLSIGCNSLFIIHFETLGIIMGGTHHLNLYNT